MISTIGCPTDDVNVYCSMQKWTDELSFQAMTSFLYFTNDKVVARLANVSKQHGGSDCSLFAIAYAETLLRALIL